jgi:carboxypeptidase family protein
VSRRHLPLLCLLALVEPMSGLESQVAQAPASAASGVITGTVRDESGKPVVGAVVQAAVRRKRWRGPYYETAVGRPDESDDRGQFRLHSLPPGSYVVVVSVTEKPPLPVESGYMRTYSPGTISLADAQPITVRAGAERSTAIRFAPVRFMFVSGVAMTSEGQPAANFSVSLRGEPATVRYSSVQGFTTTGVASTRTAPDGSFSLARVPPGVYTLTVTNGSTQNGAGFNQNGAPLEVAEVPIQVRNTSISDVKVDTARGARVSGRLEWAGAGPVPWPRDSIGRITARPVEREVDYGSVETEIRADGTFEFTNLYGLRRIAPMRLPSNWMVKSVEGPPGAMTGPNVDGKPGRTITDIRIIISDRRGRLLATVSDEDDKPYSGWVLLLPRSGPDPLDVTGGKRITYVERDVGYYRWDSVVPGSSYLAVAIDVEPSRVDGQEDLMERARAAAVPIEIGEGETTMRLRLVRLRPFVVGP